MKSLECFYLLKKRKSAQGFQQKCYFSVTSFGGDETLTPLVARMSSNLDSKTLFEPFKPCIT